MRLNRKDRKKEKIITFAHFAVFAVKIEIS